jgi:hypothetical protein
MKSLFASTEMVRAMRAPTTAEPTWMLAVVTPATLQAMLWEHVMTTDLVALARGGR